jgi:serine/threonine-protein kinase
MPNREKRRVADLIGRRLGRYEIVDLIGAGGMGEVYRARDTQLGREVAVKVIHNDIARKRVAAKRFEREAQTVAKLSHPNILSIHDFGDADGITYAVTELLEGKDLRTRLSGGRLPLSKAVKIAIEIANGLAAAHSKGVVHRDIKPENIFITSTGQVKILDFGIAGLKNAAPDIPSGSGAQTATLTETGTVVGTVGYLSPEQAQGLTAEPRSDIFSFGSVLFEMLTGDRAFQGETPRDTILAVLNRDPPPLTRLRPSVPSALEVVVERCLEKEPEERFQSARDVAFALQAVSTTDRTAPVAAANRRRATRRRRVVAGIAAAAALVLAAIASVELMQRPPPPLPAAAHLQVFRFAATGDDPELREIADGLTETVTRGLIRLEQASHGNLWVVPSDMAGKPDSASLDAAYRKFNITIGIKGLLARSGESLNLTIEALDPTTGGALRSVELTDDISNLTSLQRQPVLRIAEMIGVGDAASVGRDALPRETNIAPALTRYLRGRGVLRQADDALALETAIAHFASAVADDPLLSSARVALAEAYLQHFQATHNPVSLERGLEEAANVANGDPSRAAALRVAGSLHRASRSWDEAAAALEASLEIEPDDAEARIELGRTYQAMGRPDQARNQFYRAIYLRPGYWPGNHWLAVLYYVQGDYEAAAAEFRHVVESAPLSFAGYNNLANVYDKLGLKDTSLTALQRSIELEPENNPIAFLNLGKLYFDESRFADAAAMFEKSLAVHPDSVLTWGNLAYSYASGVDPSKTEGAARRAIDLARAELEESPDDPDLQCRLAGLHALVGEHDEGVRLIELAVAADPQDPIVIGNIAGTWEDLGDRERALEWVERAFQRGVLPSRFENRPLLRGLVADERYRSLAENQGRT